MKKVIILNGPSQSGKDTYGEILCSLFDAKHCQFKDELFDETERYFDLRKGFIKENYNSKDLIKLSDRGNRTIRECLIYVSEEVIKPKFGRDYFGKKAAENLEEGINVFTDGGFEEELNPIIDEVGIENVIVFRLHREGFTFEGDSRSYLKDREGLNLRAVGDEGDDSKPQVMKEILYHLDGVLY